MSRLRSTAGTCAWLLAMIGLVGAASADKPSQGSRPAAPGAEVSAQAAVGPPVERLLLLLPGEPLRIDLALQLDGRPLGEVWQQHIDELTAVPGGDAAGPIPLASAVQIADLAAGDFGQQRSATQLRQDLARLARQSSGREPGVPRSAVRDYIARTFPPLAIARGSAPGSAAAPALFGLLDADRDGRLTRAELAAAERRLAARDFDDDGLVSERELIVDPTQDSDLGAPDGPRRVQPAESVLWLSATASPGGVAAGSVAAAILARYDRNGDGLIQLRSQPAEMSLSAALAERIDADGDGRLDAAELERLAAEPPAAVLRLSFGSAGSSPRSERTGSERAGGDTAALRVRRKIDGGYKLHLGDVQIDVNRNNRDPRQNGRTELTLATFDADQNGYLDRSEAKANPLLAAAFDAADADHDDKLTDGELQVYVAGQNVAAAMRVRLQAVDRGQDLFSLLDANGDGLLTPRELRAAARWSMPRIATATGPSAARKSRSAGRWTSHGVRWRPKRPASPAASGRHS